MDAAKERKKWNEEPATPKQLHALRLMAQKSGRTYAVGITRGRAWQRICRATSLIRDPLRSECAPPR